MTSNTETQPIMQGMSTLEKITQKARSIVGHTVPLSDTDSIRTTVSIKKDISQPSVKGTINLSDVSDKSVVSERGIFYYMKSTTTQESMLYVGDGVTPISNLPKILMNISENFKPSILLRKDIGFVDVNDGGFIPDRGMIIHDKKTNCFYIGDGKTPFLNLPKFSIYDIDRMMGINTDTMGITP